MKYKHVIWDWNGTLLDDVNEGRKILNYMQRMKGIVETSQEEYKKIFTFPIIDYYERAGFKQEEFFELASVFIERYEIEVENCLLHKNTRKVLDNLVQIGITNSILTAGLESMVVKHLKKYVIDEFFTEVTGKKDFYASGKSELIDAHLEKIRFNPNEMVFVGDTMHDMEIAQQIGCDYLIVSQGHQDIGFASNGKINALSSLDEVMKAIVNS